MGATRTSSVGSLTLAVQVKSFALKASFLLPGLDKPEPDARARFRWIKTLLSILKVMEWSAMLLRV